MFTSLMHPDLIKHSTVLFSPFGYSLQVKYIFCARLISKKGMLIQLEQQHKGRGVALPSAVGMASAPRGGLADATVARRLQG